MLGMRRRRQPVIMFASLALLTLYLGSVSAVFSPAGRARHTAALLRGKIYFFGGETEMAAQSSDFFQLDISQNFTTSSPPFVDLTTNSTMAPPAGISSACSGSTNDSMIIYGGFSSSPNTPGLLAYNATLNSWSTQVALRGDPAAPPDRLTDMACTLDTATGQMFVFGGMATPMVNAMHVFDTTKSAWRNLGNDTAPPGRIGHTATLLPDGRIFIIGGDYVDQTITRSRNIIDIYDTKNNSWTSEDVMATARRSHTATLTKEGKILVIGDSTLSQTQPKFAVLDTKKSPLAWSFPINNDILIPARVRDRVSHTTTMVGKYMIMAFGESISNSSTRFPDIAILDTNNFTWATTFNPADAFTSAPTTGGAGASVDPQLLAIIGGVLGGVLGLGLIIILVQRSGITCCDARKRRNQIRQEQWKKMLVTPQGGGEGNV